MNLDNKTIQIVAEYKDRIEWIILSQPERFTPLKQCDKISKIIDSLVNDLINYAKTH